MKSRTAQKQRMEDLDTMPSKLEDSNQKMIWHQNRVISWLRTGLSELMGVCSAASRKPVETCLSWFCMWSFLLLQCADPSAVKPCYGGPCGAMLT